MSVADNSAATTQTPFLHMHYMRGPGGCNYLYVDIR